MYCIWPASVLVDRGVEPAWPVDVPLVPVVEERREERQALDVVPVRVPDEEVTVDRPPSPSATSTWPSSWIPVPQSSTSSVPASVRTETHDVLPPYRTVVGPALAIEPASSPERDLHCGQPTGAGKGSVQVRPSLGLPSRHAVEDLSGSATSWRADMSGNEEMRRDAIPEDVRDGDVLVYMSGRLLVVDHLVPEAFTIDLVELDREQAALRGATDGDRDTRT